MLVAVAALAFALAHWVTGSVRALERATAELADGSLKAPPTTSQGPPELRRLANTFTRTATRLQHLLQVQRAFASEASHQLKTPLTVLRLRLENFEPYLDPRAHDSLEEAVGEAERLGPYGARAAGPGPAGELRDRPGGHRSRRGRGRPRGHLDRLRRRALCRHRGDRRPGRPGLGGPRRP
ncbi:HAMP domain-containing protein [Streptomyces nigra]|uniref:HAMP domain-containing protein n=1 Tax=Streptomyces nigra TaxID=1827580 RepID=UPI0036795E75